MPEPKKISSFSSVQFDRIKIEEYFEEHELKPVLSANNIDNNKTSVRLLKHKIIWIATENETKIQIDNDLFSLDDKETINIVWDGNKDSVDFANNWDEIKLYSFKGREIIGIKMSFYPCTGLGCGVSYFLLYDLQTKAKNFFGTFNTDNKLALYDFKNDDKVDYLSKTFNGDVHGSTLIDFIFELYSMESNGQFFQQKDVAGQPYQIVSSPIIRNT